MMNKFDICDSVKIPFRGKIVNGLVEYVRSYYSGRKYNYFYYVSVEGAKHYKKISEEDLTIYNHSKTKTNRHMKVAKNKAKKIVIKKSMCGSKITSCQLSGDIDFEEFCLYIKSLYLDCEVIVK